MEDNFRSPPSWGQILRSRPLHAGLGGVIHKFETSLVDGHFEKLYTFCCYKFETNLDGPLEKYIFRNIHLCAQLHFNAATAKTMCSQVIFLPLLVLEPPSSVHQGTIELCRCHPEQEVNHSSEAININLAIIIVLQHEVDRPLVRLDLDIVHGEQADIAVLVGPASGLAPSTPSPSLTPSPSTPSPPTLSTPSTSTVAPALVLENLCHH